MKKIIALSVITVLLVGLFGFANNSQAMMNRQIHHRRASMLVDSYKKIIKFIFNSN